MHANTPVTPSLIRPGVSELDFVAPPAWYLPLKGLFDVVAAVVLLIVFAPLIAFLVLLVKCTSAGPAVYAQVRLGQDRQRFLVYKIRTMYHDCERLTGPRWATTDDPRVTPLGRFLRKAHLDELPQLWNVLRGEMSLVGPRPERPEFVEQLERALPDYALRLLVRPGVTGLAQVQLPPDSDLESVRRKIVCDVHYIGAMSPWLDGQLLLATATKVFGVPCERSCQALRVPTLAQIEAARSRPAPSSPTEAHCLIEPA